MEQGAADAEVDKIGDIWNSVFQGMSKFLPGYLRYL